MATPSQLAALVLDVSSRTDDWVSFASLDWKATGPTYHHRMSTMPMDMASNKKARYPRRGFLCSIGPR